MILVDRINSATDHLIVPAPTHTHDINYTCIQRRHNDGYIHVYNAVEGVVRVTVSVRRHRNGGSTVPSKGRVQGRIRVFYILIISILLFSGGEDKWEQICYSARDETF